jgi:hypothetical protein
MFSERRVEFAGAHLQSRYAYYSHRLYTPAPSDSLVASQYKALYLACAHGQLMEVERIIALVPHYNALLLLNEGNRSVVS